MPVTCGARVIVMETVEDPDVEAKWEKYTSAG